MNCHSPILGLYNILSLTYDLILYIWCGYTPRTTSKTGTPTLKASRRTISSGNPLDVVKRVLKSRTEARGCIVCSFCLVFPELIKHSLERDQSCVYRVGVLCMFLCVCVETEGPKASCWCWGAWLETQWDFSHSCLRCLCPLWCGHRHLRRVTDM